MIIFNFFQEYTVQRPWRITKCLMHADTLSVVGFKPSSMLQEIVFSLENVKLGLRIEYQTIPMFHGLPFLLLGGLLLSIALVWLGKKTNRLLSYILESEIKDYLLYYYIFLQYDNITNFLNFQTWGDMLSCCCYALQNWKSHTKWNCRTGVHRFAMDMKPKLCNKCDCCSCE